MLRVLFVVATSVAFGGCYLAHERPRDDARLGVFTFDPCTNSGITVMISICADGRARVRLGPIDAHHEAEEATWTSVDDTTIEVGGTRHLRWDEARARWLELDPVPECADVSILESELTESFRAPAAAQHCD